ncbi:SURF1 family protein [Mycetocola tolaasinivorans]|uniref:SURF1-like protein n=2 Tax=Mycetocola tolaasinivorans TaxID=76635 RepID=A0A3L7AB55_9MICO|nr:SURF1 family protein [Mycetocola tolaasinivorans]
MRRPRWIGVLVLALVIAGAFAALGQWQLARAVAVDPNLAGPTEVMVPLQTVIKPGEPLHDVIVGQQVSLSGEFVPGDYVILGTRLNGDVKGFWVTGHFRVDGAQPASMAVALGWAPTRADAQGIVDRLSATAATPMDLTGRLVPPQGPLALDAKTPDPFLLNEMSVAALINVWDGPAGEVYLPYLISFEAPDGLTKIDAPKPVMELELNWLNIFYAIEWAVFAGFAVFLWYRLTRDAWEKEVDEAAEKRGDPSPFE